MIRSDDENDDEKAAEALDLLPEEMREPAVAYLLEQAEKFRALKEQIAEGLEDVAVGRVSEWNFEEFLRHARVTKLNMTDPKRVPLDGEIRDGRHVLTVRVYYEDTDFTGIVYHASYLRFMERGRTNYLRMIGADHRALFEETAKEAPGFAFVVRSMNIDFLKPARMDDVLEVLTEPHDVKGASAMVRQRVMRGDELLVEAHVRVAFISGGRARPIPKPLRIAMKADQDAAQS